MSTGLTVRQWQKKRRAIIDSREGCDCPNVIDGRLVPADMRCNKKWVRCNGVIRVRHAALEALGPKPEERTTERRGEAPGRNDAK